MIVILESRWVWRLRTTRYVALPSKVIRIEIRKIPRAVVTTIGQRTGRTPLWIENPASETCSEVVWEWTSQTSSWTEDCPQCSLLTALQYRPRHPPCSKQSLSRAQTTWLSQTATTISTSMSPDFLALPLGTYKAVFVHEFLI